MTKMTRRNIVKIGLATLAVSFSVSLSQAATVHDVKIEGMAFSPVEITIKAGDTIRWTNVDGAPHTATDIAEEFDTEALSKGKSAEIVMSKPGNYDYFCQIHPGMKGKITVTD